MSSLLSVRGEDLPSELLCTAWTAAQAFLDSRSPPLQAHDWWKQSECSGAGKNPFAEDEAATSFANALLRAPSLPHGPPELGLRRIQLDIELPKMPESRDLFSRKPVIDELSQWTQEEVALMDKLRKSNRSPHAVIEGAQGIGKSLSLFWLLRVLLQRGEHVVLHSVQTSTVYQFVPPRLGDGLSAHTDAQGWPIYRAFSCDERDFRYGSCAALDNKKAFYLYDAAGEKGQSYVAQAHTVTATFSHSAHYRQRKTEADRWYFMSPWTLPELLAVAQEMGRESRIVRTLPDKENMHPQQLCEAVLERVRSGFNICGGSVRDIFQRDPRQVMDGQNTMLTKLHRSVHLGALAVDKEGYVDGETDPTCSSRLYSYHSVFPFRLSQRWREFVSQRVACAARPMTSTAIMKDVRAWLTGRERPFVDTDEAKTRYEELAVDAISRGGSFPARLAPIKSLRKRSRKPQDTTSTAAQRNDLQAKSSLDLKPMDMEALYRMREDLRTDVVTACLSLPSVKEQRADGTLSRLVISWPSWMRYTDRFPFVDCVDAKDRGYRFAVTMEHPIDPHRACEFLRRVGATEERPFHLYFVVPRDLHAKELTQSIEGVSRMDADQRRMLSKCLVHHVMVIDEEDWKPADFLRAVI